MAISRSPVVSNLGAFVVIDTDADENVQTNTTGAAGAMFMLSIDNTNTSAVVFVKFWDATGGISVGTTAPNYIFRANASTKHTLVLPEGLTFLTGFSHACVTGPGTAGGSGPPSAVPLRYVTN